MQFDKDCPEGTWKQINPTFWFERAFTKAEYAELAKAMDTAIAHTGRSPLLDDLRKDFADRAISGYGSGL